MHRSLACVLRIRGYRGRRRAATAAAAPAELAQALQKKYDSIRDFSADFVHTYKGGVLRKQITEKGHLLIKKPGKMRWDYTAPEPKQFVSDGVKVYSYIPAGQAGHRQNCATDDDTASTPALFLTGKGNLTRDFTAVLRRCAGRQRRRAPAR